MIFRKNIKRYLNAGKTALISHLKTNQYDVLVAFAAFPAGWLAWQGSLASEIPFAIWSLGPDTYGWIKKPLLGSLIRRSLRGASYLFADGDQLSEKITTTSGKECVFLPSMYRLRANLSPIRREKFFLYSDKIEKNKGIFDLVRAFARVKKDIWDYRLLIIGTGSQEENLRKAIESYKLRGKVHMLGQVTGEEYINYLQRARALVIPSHNDSIPFTFGEALQTATPLIVTNVGDMGTLVRDNRLGFAVQKRSISGLTDAMVKMMVTEFDITESARALTQRFSSASAVSTFLEVVNG